ncbi:MAG: hypothetical protein DRJ61_11370 [Acidobacteria bacterium]|nr:MAG: hypothetical protein DRJ61_11370 [Acidobacteriota bacterium]
MHRAGARLRAPEGRVWDPGAGPVGSFGDSIRWQVQRQRQRHQAPIHMVLLNLEASFQLFHKPEETQPVISDA